MSLMIYIIDFITYTIRIQPLRDLFARALRLDRLSEEYRRAERNRALTSETNNGISYLVWTTQMLIIANRYNDLKFFFEPTLIPPVDADRIRRTEFTFVCERKRAGS